MTLAADELLNSDIKIIDLALKYNYDSPEAFTRAYQSFHGYPPSVTRKFGVFNKYEKISVHINNLTKRLLSVLKELWKYYNTTPNKHKKLS